MPDSKDAFNVPSEEDIASVATRSQSSIESKLTSVHPLMIPAVRDLNITNAEFIKLQADCPTLKDIRDYAKNGKKFVRKNHSYAYDYDNNVLVKRILEAENSQVSGKSFLVVPNKLRRIVLELAHDSPLSGHFSHRKTYQKVSFLYFWPGMTVDIYNYCRSCDVCQRFGSKGRLKKAELVKMPVISVPFEKVAVDIVGPIKPRSSAGCSYVLTLVDYATSFPEAVPLKNITSIDVAEALVTIFSRVGIPKVIVSDRGTQFTSDLMGKVYELVSMKPVFTTPYHPMANGKVERQHSILKSILKKLCHLQPKEWDGYLPCALFSMREVPTDTSGFSPFELLYGRQARGPLGILHEMWSNGELSKDTQNSYQFLLDLRSRLEETAQIAAENTNIAMKQYKTYFDARSTNRSFIAGDEVLVMLPDNSNKLLLAWQGHYKVLKKVNKVDYAMDVKGKTKLFHVNLLKKYIRRSTVCLSTFDGLSSSEVIEEVTSPNVATNLCIIEDSPDTELPTVSSENPSIENFKLGKSLTGDMVADLQGVLKNFDNVFSDIPGCTSTITHTIKLKTNEPLKSKFYPVPIHLTKEFESEVSNLLKLGIIEPSNSPYCVPVVLIKKPDTTYRLALDLRVLNSVTVFDCEPMPLIDQDFYKFTGAVHFSEIDITKAYYQIVLDPDSRKFTAFQTPQGLMQFTRMPFGLSTACASYIRLMRKVFDGVSGISVYFDNILIFSKDWPEHMQIFQNVLTLLEKHGLTGKASKCSIGLTAVTYLGFTISDNTISPDPVKCSKIVDIDYPKCKKELQSFLGTCNFYQRFIPNISSLTANLSNLLKKNHPDKFELSDDLKQQFDTLKMYFESDLILRLPDITKTFVVRSDASQNCIGAVLLQYWNEVPHPVAYAGRKLNKSELNYSVIEKECLSLIFAIKKFEYYLVGKYFIAECDHRPLSYLEHFKGKNGRLLRWSLFLQQYRYTVVYIKGINNHFADLLSRSWRQ